MTDPITTKLLRSTEAEIVDPGIRKYIRARRQPRTDAQIRHEKPFAGKWVARRKTDAEILAFADEYEDLEVKLQRENIDPDAVVFGMVFSPDTVLIRHPDSSRGTSSST